MRGPRARGCAAGGRLGVVLTVRILRGPLRKVSFSVPVSRSLKPGRHELHLTGTGLDDPSAGASEICSTWRRAATAPEDTGADPAPGPFARGPQGAVRRHRALRRDRRGVHGRRRAVPRLPRPEAADRRRRLDRVQSRWSLVVSRLGSADQLFEQLVEGPRRVLGQARVGLARLDDRARRRDQPAEAVEGGRAAIRPASGSPAATRTSASRWGRTSRRESGASAIRRVLVQRDLRAQEVLRRQKTTTPALMRSPRSTRGTTRRIAYANGLRGRGHAPPPRRSRAAPSRAEQVVDVGRAPGPSRRASRRARGRRRARARSSTRGASRASASRDRARAGQQHVVGDRRERAPRRPRRARAAVLAVERRAVVDQPEPAVPEQQVGLLRGAVDVRHERVEPDDVGGELGSSRAGRRRRRAARRGGSRPRGSCPALAGMQVLDLGSGSARPSAGSTSTTHELRHRETEGPRQLADDDLGDQRRGPWPAPRNFSDVEPVVVGLDEAGQRSALPQRGDVARRGDGAQGYFGGSWIWSGGPWAGAAAAAAARRPARSTPKRLGELAAGVHLGDDVAAADELAVDEELRDRRPVRSAVSSWRMRGSGRMSTAANGAPSACSAATCARRSRRGAARACPS